MSLAPLRLQPVPLAGRHLILPRRFWPISATVTPRSVFGWSGLLKEKPDVG